MDHRKSSSRLGLEFVVRTDVALIRNSDDKSMAFPSEKTLTFWLTPKPRSAEIPWLIDGFKFDVADRDVVKRKALIKTGG